MPPAIYGFSNIWLNHLQSFSSKVFKENRKNTQKFRSIEVEVNLQRNSNQFLSHHAPPLWLNLVSIDFMQLIKIQFQDTSYEQNHIIIARFLCPKKRNYFKWILFVLFGTYVFCLIHARAVKKERKVRLTVKTWQTTFSVSIDFWLKIICNYVP